MRYRFFILPWRLLFLFPGILFAYLDPGTGSYFLQMFIAGFMGGLFTLKVFWKKIKTFFSNRLQKYSRRDQG